MSNKYAFRCKNCGRLHTSDDAAEASHPHCCKVCSSGIVFDKHGIKTQDNSIWEILSDCTSDRLQELGLSQSDVEKHKKWSKVESSKRDPINVSISIEDNTNSKDDM